MKTTKQQEHHYVYKITNNNPTDSRKYYIGVRTAKGCSPEEDTKYWSSSIYMNEAIDEIGQENFTKEILSTWETREEANSEEVRIHWEIDVAKDPEFYNKANATSDKFCPYGHVTVLDTRDGKTKNVSKSDFDKFDYYEFINLNTLVVIDLEDGLSKRISVQNYNKHKNKYKTFRTGKVAVIDLRSNETKSVSVEEARNNEFYKYITTDKIPVIDKRDNTYKSVSREAFNKHNYYVSVNKNKVTVFDMRDNTTKNVNVEEYVKFDFYVATTSKKYTFLNSNDDVEFTIIGNYTNFCKKNNLPYMSLRKSFNKPENRIYSTNMGKAAAKKTNREHLVGWWVKVEDIINK